MNRPKVWRRRMQLTSSTRIMTRKGAKRNTTTHIPAFLACSSLKTNYSMSSVCDDMITCPHPQVYWEWEGVCVFGRRALGVEGLKYASIVWIHFLSFWDLSNQQCNFQGSNNLAKISLQIWEKKLKHYISKSK